MMVKGDKTRYHGISAMAAIMRRRSRRADFNFVLILVAASLSSSHGIAQVVEEFPVAFGIPPFGEQAEIRGNIVLWQRYGRREDGIEPDLIEYKDISRLDNPVLGVVAYSASSVGVLLTPQHLYWGNSHLGEVYARSVEELYLRAGGTNILVATGPVTPIAATEDYCFLERFTVVDHPDGGAHYEGAILARSTKRFDGTVPDAGEIAVAFRDLPFRGRNVAASTRFLVWHDRDPFLADRTWRIYAKPVDKLFTAGAERHILDTNTTSGVSLAVHENLLVVEAQEGKEVTPETTRGIYLYDLDTGEGPFPIATSHDEETRLVWPAISSEYVVWAEVVGFFQRTAYARRLVADRPFGPPVVLGPGGSWITIDRNIAIWNGSTQFKEGDVVHEAIMAVELVLPEADDVGDVDQDGHIDLTDAVAIVQYLFLSGSQPRLRPSDADLNRKIELADAVKILAYLFRGEPRPGIE